MSEEQATDGQQIADTIPASVDDKEAAENQTTQTETKTNGTYQPPVDLSSLPDDLRAPIEGRFAHLSRLMKKNESKYEGRLSERDNLLAQQAKIIEELQSGVGMVVDHLQDKSLNDAESRIMERLETAHEAGDTKAYLAAQRDLIKLENKKTLLEERKAAAPKQERQVQQQLPRNASSVANDAATEGAISSEDAVMIKAAQDETDDYGNLLRPWAHASTADPKDDPEFIRSVVNAQVIWQNPKFRTTEQKIAELDRIMGTRKTSAGQSVMGGSLTSQRRNGKITLTPNQERIAVRTKFGGSKAKSDSDHIEAYRKQVADYNAKKGAR